MGQHNGEVHHSEFAIVRSSRRRTSLSCDATHQSCSLVVGYHIKHRNVFVDGVERRGLKQAPAMSNEASIGLALQNAQAWFRRPAVTRIDGTESTVANWSGWFGWGKE